ncbi:MAG: tetratricopeptide repeat protein [Alphaproteobacteria bacterium]|nr:tetratricopeptide repeat protein [Alphaproteobacteria bacterium]
MTLQTAGRLDAALDVYNDVLARQPDLLDAINNRAKALHELGRHDDALAGYRALLSVAPEHSAGWNNLGVLWRDRDRAELALTSFVRALCIDPGQGGLHNNLGTVAWDLGQDGRAIAAYEKAWSLAPDLADAALNLGFALTGQGRYRDAVETYRTAAKHHPGGPRFPIRQALALPAVCESVDEIVGLRAGLEAFLDSEKARTLRFEDPISVVGSANFFRVYHGMDDRPPAERIAVFHRRCCPRLSWSAPHCNGARRRLATRPRLGICSKYLSRHTIGLLFAGVIERLAASGQFEIVILRPPGRQDEISKRIDAAADHVVHLPGNLVGAQEAIAEARLDVLLYTDIGMEPMTYFLAFAHLARSNW